MKFPKVIATIFIVGVILAIVLGAVNAIEGGYLHNASFISIIFYGCLIAVVGYLAYLGIRKLWWVGFIAIALLTIQGCNYAKSNQQVVISEDCGNNWRQIQAGSTVPKGTGNYCYMKVVMPNFPMQGDCRFIANFEDQVRVFTIIDYDYQIVDPLTFIKQAKYLGKANADADEDTALDPKEFETAENTVIDKRLRDVAKSTFLTEDIVDYDQAELEKMLEEKTNAILKEFGCELNFITLTFLPDEQTRQAIDVATAMRIYESNGLGELGTKVMIARAGAAKISISGNTGEAESAEAGAADTEQK